jgi:hypothetical protein
MFHAKDSASGFTLSNTLLKSNNKGTEAFLQFGLGEAPEGESISFFSLF